MVRDERNQRKNTFPVTLINERIGQEEENSVKDFQGSCFADSSTDRGQPGSPAQSSAVPTVTGRRGTLPSSSLRT